MKEFKLNNVDFIPLCDLLKATGLCQTGGHAKLVIGEGEVTVDGQVETRKRCKINAGQTISFAGQEIKVLK
ncbi:RNA-binding S4 domain-containing protein [Bacteriovorax sp. Seq25_V]|uniref:RNA-binding S4 domain-containing protein n=1 Tax=Bacteriovorax sp. Seq25_V TaxID=1201288 RepID=UPI00038A26F5|nr:RNA-binding S4 domain-containing protein [Bacteriovorax sp. Seq25_V]EQC47480.1 hypothetical protein M900_1022 [Bacteriovorax sp. Seq25_V]